jgi:hypothetical protein
VPAHLDNNEDIVWAWFDDESAPAQAAKRALEAIGTPDALAIVASSPPK